LEPVNIAVSFPQKPVKLLMAVANFDAFITMSTMIAAMIVQLTISIIVLPNVGVLLATLEPSHLPSYDKEHDTDDNDPQ